MAPRFTRRQFINSAVAAGAAFTLPGCPPGQPPPTTGGVVVFKRSGYKRRVSNAAKKHNANRLYRNLGAAQGDPPHPGDNSKVVERTISNQLFNTLFSSPGKLVADLRRDL
jgi:hypothetical protein